MANIIYVTSDLHGEYDLFIKLLEEINFNKEIDKLYILGDVVDRGDKSIELLQFIYKNQDSMILLKGNHEDMMVNALSSGNYHIWFPNGGASTYDSYYKLNESEQQKLFNYTSNLPCLLQIKTNDKDYILSHAGVETDHNGKILLQQDQDFLLWAREEFLYNTEIANDIVAIIGHTPTITIQSHNKDSIWHSECGKKICIDCGATFGYNLACLRLDDMKEFYILNKQ